MSERASFTTEYVYCPQCFAAVREVLCADDVASEHGYIARPSVPLNRRGDEAPIVCGAVYSSFAGGASMVFEYDLRDKIEPKLCHPVRVVVLPDSNADPVVILWEPLSEPRRD